MEKENNESVPKILFPGEYSEKELFLICGTLKVKAKCLELNMINLKII